MIWEKIQLAIYCDAPLDVVRWHWRTEAGITRWFVPKCEFKSRNGERLNEIEPIKAGDRYRWEWANGVVEEGAILGSDSEDVVNFSFGEATSVSVTLRAEGGRTLVELEQITDGDEEQRVSVYKDCQQGWTFYLTNLKSMIEGGLDLREVDPERGCLVNV
jgi:uncharacterized protein YndB with AHSA1/START domain